MAVDNLDRFPTIGICVSCGAEIKYSPIRMPLGRPHINADRPGHFSIEYGPMCVPCIRNQLDVLMEKVNRGEMYPTNTWEADEEGSAFHIVPTMQSDSPVEEPPSGPEMSTGVPEPEAEEKPGCLGRLLNLFRWIY
jgi:hypothetical protein